jgi:hypothetical protein
MTARDELAHAAKLLAEAINIMAREELAPADEYDAAQERGEVAGPADGSLGRSNGERPATAADLGLSHKDIHEFELAAGERSPPGFNGLPDPSGMIAGERILVAGCRGWIENRYTLGKGDERESFWLLDKDGTRVASAMGRENAEAKLREFEKTGKVSA